MADFDDFFDAPVDVHTPKSVSLAHRETVSPNSTPPSVRKAVEDTDRHLKKKDSPRVSDEESDPSYTDFSDDHESDGEPTKQKIEAKIPRVGQHSDESEDESQKARNYKSDKLVTGVKYEKDSSILKDRRDSFSGASGTDYTLSDTDSDVTDVSPLNTPHLSPKRKHGNNYNKRPPKSPADLKEKVTYYDADGKYELYKGSDKDDLNILMQAVLEMEKDKQSQYLKDERIARSRRVMFAPSKAKAYERKNFSFSNDKVSTIDKENQRLMEKIMKMAVEGKKKQNHTVQKKKLAPTKITPSAVNRLKEQRKIEQENMALLKRLQSTKATRGIKRDDLLKDYEHKTIAGQSVAAAHNFKVSSPYQMNIIGYGRRSQSMSEFESSASVVLEDRGFHYKARPSHAVTYIGDEGGDKASVVLQSKRHVRPASASTTHSFGTKSSRPASAKQRPSSAHSGTVKKRSSLGSRPEWDSAW